MSEQAGPDIPAAAGRVTIAPAVLAQIVERATLGTPGVVAMCTRHPRFDRLRDRTFRDTPSGIHLRLVDDTVNAEIAIVAQTSVNIVDLGQRIQQEVGGALEHIAGLRAGEINVYVDDIAP
ncbi:MAG: Asp23/Gls24 family envelope stress response protein [Thermomicrobiales bacterium]|nr:Asp23/Gls24 family envelope stress response protein [Thermomicrobiales bacterium]